MRKPLNIIPSATSSERDFDCIIGKWHVHHRKLKERLKGSDAWIEFEGTAVGFAILEGWGNIKRYRAEFDGIPFEEMALRIFNRDTRLWTIHWVDTKSLTLDIPVVGSFDGKVGRFFSRDKHEDTEIIIRCTYDATDCDAGDEGATWETNWVMTAYREPRACA